MADQNEWVDVQKPKADSDNAEWVDVQLPPTYNANTANPAPKSDGAFGLTKATSIGDGKPDTLMERVARTHILGGTKTIGDVANDINNNKGKIALAVASVVAPEALGATAEMAPGTLTGFTDLSTGEALRDAPTAITYGQKLAGLTDAAVQGVNAFAKAHPWLARGVGFGGASAIGSRLTQRAINALLGK